MKKKPKIAIIYYIISIGCINIHYAMVANVVFSAWMVVMSGGVKTTKNREKRQIQDGASEANLGIYTTCFW
ncbi:MAG: hypothetical protein J6C56_05965 [Alistipes sp.]|nr:hypothetical protein [Alistipes sp.]